MSLQELKRVSAELGRDRLHVQGAGGNTSIKVGETMRIKASGTLLADADEKDIFVPVDWQPYREALIADPLLPVSAQDFALGGSLRPSIETPLHAVFEDRVVLHTHCVETIAWAVRTDAEPQLAARLDGKFRWHFVPYARPGQPLLPGILEGIERGANVFVLGNHGLIVRDETVELADDLLRSVSEALRHPPRVARVELSNAETLMPYVAAETWISDQILAHPLAKAILRAGPLYPDHVVFLELSPIWCDTLEEADEAMRNEEPAIVLSGSGAFLNPQSKSGAAAMLACFADVLSRLADDATLRHLTRAECAELMDWDAEKYRQALGQ
ncbi:MAG: class II aldolase [Rhizobiaceae bacterium]|nr:class II aldolase [Rhizobiaceae bacterium]